MTYQPRPKTLKRLARIEFDLGLKPMRLMHDMAAAGFTSEAIAEKLEIPCKTVRRLLAGKGIVPGKTVLAGRGTKGGPRPWKNNHQKRIEAITAARNAKAIKYQGKTIREWCEHHGVEHNNSTKNQVRRQLLAGIPGEQLAIRRTFVADERQSGIMI